MPLHLTWASRQSSTVSSLNRTETSRPSKRRRTWSNLGFPPTTGRDGQRLSRARLGVQHAHQKLLRASHGRHQPAACLPHGWRREQRKRVLQARFRPERDQRKAEECEEADHRLHCAPTQTTEHTPSVGLQPRRGKVTGYLRFHCQVESALSRSKLSHFSRALGQIGQWAGSGRLLGRLLSWLGPCARFRCSSGPIRSKSGLWWWSLGGG
jgi:hypothetical protein